jgi:hypothetical protein
MGKWSKKNNNTQKPNPDRVGALWEPDEGHSNGPVLSGSLRLDLEHLEGFINGSVLEIKIAVFETKEKQKENSPDLVIYRSKSREEREAEEGGANKSWKKKDERGQEDPPVSEDDIPF